MCVVADANEKLKAPVKRREVHRMTAVTENLSTKKQGNSVLLKESQNCFLKLLALYKGVDGPVIGQRRDKRTQFLGLNVHDLCARARVNMEKKLFRP